MPLPAADDAVPEYDVVVVGGGVNGTGIARDLAGRGASVLLCEKDDLAAHTSSSSTKLIHGGLRYLEYREFSLVRKALGEREILLKGAPHIMWPLRFVMPHDPSMRPVWLIRLGLFLYDHLARREVLPASRTVDLHTHPAGQPLKPQFTKGFVYSDGWVDDARLVALCAVDASERGATVLTRTACIHAERGAERWRVRLQSDGGEPREVSARVLVNAAGPWAASFLSEQVHVDDKVHLRLIKGSHLVVPKLFEHDHAYIFQNPDGRIIFAIPYEHDFTLIGTTDVEHHGPIGEAKADAEEIAYLCDQASRYFAKPVLPADVVWTYSGVRPLLDDESGNPAAVTRDYRLELDVGAAGDAGAEGAAGATDSTGPGRSAGSGKAPLLSVWGGKITTFRKLAEEAADRLSPYLALGKAWTAGAILPGGDLRAFLGGGAPAGNDVVALFEQFVAQLVTRFPSLPASMLRRMARAYGTRTTTILDGDLGDEVVDGLYEAELAYLRRVEWARTGDDALWRRSKLGLHFTLAERDAVEGWMSEATFPR